MRVGEDRIEFRVTTGDGAGGLVAAEVRMAPGGGPRALHRHHSAEIYRVEDGRLTFYVEDDAGVVKRFVAGVGRTVAIPGGREHTIRNESSAEAAAFVVYAPGEPMEAFARAAATLGAAGPPSIERVFAVATEHGIEITRPVEEIA